VPAKLGELAEGWVAHGLADGCKLLAGAGLAAGDAGGLCGVGGEVRAGRDEVGEAGYDVADVEAEVLGCPAQKSEWGGAGQVVLADAYTYSL
jgi:hypothetical protein